MIKTGSKRINNLSLLIRLWSHFKQKRKIQIVFLSILIIINGLAEFISFASVIPFLNIITKPENVLKNLFFKNLFNFFGLSGFEEISILITLIFVFTILTSASIRILNLWLISKISAAIGSDLSTEIYKKVLYQPYEYHLNKNSSELTSTITFEVNRTTEYILLSLQFVSGISLMFFLVTGFISFNWYLGTPTIFTYVLLYLIFMFSFKYRLSRNSRLIVNYTENQIKSISNGLGSIRDILLDNNQKEFVNNFLSNDYPLRNLLAQRYFLGVMPRFVLEALGIIIIAFLSIYLLFNRYDNSLIITLLGGLAIISQKLLPSMQLCYNSWSNLRNTRSSVLKVLDSLNLKIEKQYNGTINKLNFNEKIEVRNLYFKFENYSNFSIENISFSIKKGQRIGIIGETGSGKSTLINLIMGLLEPSSGGIYIDDVLINSKKDKSRILSWKKSLAHVPQNIYLSDQTFAENIAFGVPKSEIDMDKVKKVSKLSLISSLIESYKNGYYTYVGERGIRLSGGQKQRIGLARALYKDSKILILDEATSALDNKTENKIMEAINKLNKDITIIIVAHRLSTLSECNQILELKSGSIFRKD